MHNIEKSAFRRKKKKLIAGAGGIKKRTIKLISKPRTIRLFTPKYTRPGEKSAFKVMTVYGEILGIFPSKKKAIEYAHAYADTRKQPVKIGRGL